MRVTRKGQVTIPKHIRERLGIGPGSMVEFVEKRGEVVVLAEGIGKRQQADQADRFSRWLDRHAGKGRTGLDTEAFMKEIREAEMPGQTGAVE